MPVTIKNRFTNEPIATVNDTDDVREAVVRLVKKGVDLYGANLYRANLTRANLDGANLTLANLYGANLTRANLYGANLYRANLTLANLYRANLDGANLTLANLDGANLYGANLYRANLDGANLTPIRIDLHDVLSFAIAEVPALIAALDEGRVNGKVYSDGACGCLVGTLAIASGADPTNDAQCNAVHGLHGNGDRPAERFFLCIEKGDTSATSQAARLARDWAQEWYDRIAVAFSKPPIGKLDIPQPPVPESLAKTAAAAV